MVFILLTEALTLSFNLHFNTGLIIAIILGLCTNGIEKKLSQICRKMENKRNYDRTQVKELLRLNIWFTEKRCNSDVSLLNELFLIVTVS